MCGLNSTPWPDVEFPAAPPAAGSTRLCACSLFGLRTPCTLLHSCAGHWHQYNPSWPAHQALARCVQAASTSSARAHDVPLCSADERPAAGCLVCSRFATLLMQCILAIATFNVGAEPVHARPPNVCQTCESITLWLSPYCDTCQEQMAAELHVLYEFKGFRTL